MAPAGEQLHCTQLSVLQSPASPHIEPFRQLWNTDVTRGTCQMQFASSCDFCHAIAPVVACCDRHYAIPFCGESFTNNQSPIERIDHNIVMFVQHRDGPLQGWKLVLKRSGALAHLFVLSSMVHQRPWGM